MNEEIGGGNLIRNRAKCLECGDVIESKSQHDFVTCKCGKLSVDGGLEYKRRVYGGDYEEMSEYDWLIS